MATVSGPLHSDSASGSVIKQLTFQKSRRGHIVRGYNKPGSLQPFAPSAAQLALRAQTKAIMQEWAVLTTEQQSTSSAWPRAGASFNAMSFCRRTPSDSPPDLN